MSLVPDLRCSKIQGQTELREPRLVPYNVGFDADVTPKLKFISNVNLLWFEETEVLEQFVFQSDIARFIGTDLSMGLEYRPVLNNNIDHRRWRLRAWCPAKASTTCTTRSSARSRVVRRFMELALTF